MWLIFQYFTVIAASRFNSSVFLESSKTIIIHSNTIWTTLTVLRVALTLLWSCLTLLPSSTILYYHVMTIRRWWWYRLVLKHGKIRDIQNIQMWYQTAGEITCCSQFWHLAYYTRRDSDIYGPRGYEIISHWFLPFNHSFVSLQPCFQPFVFSWSITTSLICSHISYSKIIVNK